MWKPLDDSVCELGESPFWHPAEQSLYWLDIPGRQALRTRGNIAGSGARIERWSLPTEPGCMAPAHGGGLVMALRDGFYRARAWGGPLEPIARVDHDVRKLRFNDGKCDPEGRFWASTINEAKDGAIAALYCLDLRGGTAKVDRMANEATNGNGLDFSLDGRTLYWADTAAARVRAWDRDPDTQGLWNERTYLQFPPKPQGWRPEAPGHYAGRPDGATTDAEGGYWIALFEGAQLQCFSPDGGLRRTLPLPVRCPTMPCLGGDDLRTLFVTTARQGRPAAELAAHPASGHVLVGRSDVAGRPVNFFQDA